MSVIAGMYNLDGAAVEESHLVRLASLLGSRRFDSDATLISGCVGMVHRAPHNDLQSPSEVQPYVSPFVTVLTWDGRVDNRGELLEALQINRDATDVEIVLQSYLKWGMLCLEKIIGDFGLALWDPETQTLLLARDAIGPRTLYYTTSNRRVAWATQLSALLDVSGETIRINDEYVAGFLTKLPTTGLTPYVGFHSVPPGCVVLVNKSQIRSHRFWGPEVHKQIRYTNDSNYEEQFRSLFKESVAARLRVSGPAWAELSGGMDSSPIVCMAHRLISDRVVGATSLRTVSRVYDEAKGSDERKYIQFVEAKIGITGVHLKEDEYRILSIPAEEYVPCIPSYVSVFRSYYKAVDRLMKFSGGRTMLTGFGGDEVQLGDGEPFPELVELLIQGKLLTLHRSARDWSQSFEQPYWQFLRRRLIAPVLPPAIQRERNKTVTALVKFYNPEFVKRMSLRERLFDTRCRLGFLCGSHYRLNQLLYSIRQTSGGFWAELCDIEFTYPFLHRPLLEFMLAIPANQIARPNEAKSLCKRALRDLLPEELITRKEKRITIWHAANLAAEREALRLKLLFANAHPVVDEYLNRKAVLSAFGPNGKPDVLLLSLAPFVEWIEAVQRRRDPIGRATRAA